jgi:hypothetical protein
VQRVRDRDPVERLDEEEVEEQPGRERAGDGRPQAADEGDDHHEQLEDQYLAGDGLLTAQTAQRPGKQGQPSQGQCEPAEAPFEGERPTQGRERARTRFRVGDDVHVDVARLADHRAGCPCPGEEGSQAPATADTDHKLCRVHRTRELDEAAPDLLADDLVVAAAERLDELPLGSENPGVGLCEAIGSGHVHGEEAPAR